MENGKLHRTRMRCSRLLRHYARYIKVLDAFRLDPPPPFPSSRQILLLFFFFFVLYIPAIFDPL